MRGDGAIGFIVGVFMSCFMFLPIMLFNEARVRGRFEREAVKHGAATWSVDENGNRVFKWKGQE